MNTKVVLSCAALLLLLAGCQRARTIQKAEPDAGRDADAAVPMQDAGGEPDATAPAEDAAMPTDAGSDEPADAMADASDMFDDEDGGITGPRDPDPPCDVQLEEALDGLPDDLICAGLYTDVWRKLLSPDARFYAPAYPLWSDGSGKQRWVILPKGEKIDATDQAAWVMPVGTQLWKEFRVNGRRVETRVLQKTREDRWVRATYEWNRDETWAVRSFGSDRDDVMISGTVYHVPTGSECDQCHGGAKDRVLGFSMIALGLPGAEGLTLEKLVEEDLLDPAPVRTSLVIGDDGTDKGAEAMGWLHHNCGVSCHNSDQNAEAYSTDLFLTLRPTELDGRPSNQFDALQNTVNVDMLSERWGTDRKRIVPGSPEQSVLYQLIATRIGDSKEQMPPIASQLVDPINLTHVREWIAAMPAE
ncbi:MAG: hypothetical protein OXT09_36855 [Myxococcales bacterium]|nr:hypothetical protein [Myxococcales bacterium]